MPDHTSRVSLPSLQGAGRWCSRSVRERVTLFVETLEVVVRMDASGEELVTAMEDLTGAAWRGDVLTLYRGAEWLELRGEGPLDRTWHVLTNRACAVPEVTRGLRALGAHRPQEEQLVDAHQRFFAPLLQARRRLESDEPMDWRVAGFDTAALDERLRGVLSSLAQARHAVRPPHRRALEAILLEACEPLFERLAVVGSAARVVHGCDDAERFERWRAWSRGVRGVFLMADESWSRMVVALTDEARRWPMSASAP